MENRFIKDVLDSIHAIIRLHNYRLSEEEKELTDKKILPFLKDYLSQEEKEYRVICSNSGVKIESPKMIPVACYYFALTQGTVDLWNALKDANYSFGKVYYHLRLYALDKELSSKFSKEEYISYLKEYDGVFKHFMGSLGHFSKEEKSSLIQDFSDIIHESPDTLEVGKRGNTDFLNARNIQFFGKDFLIHTNSVQRDIINSSFFHIHGDSYKKIKDYLEAYPYTFPKVPFTSSFLDTFTIDEFANMSDKDARLYQIAESKSLLSRMKELLDLDPSFDCPDSFIREEIFRVLDNSTILSLTKEGKKEIAGMKIPFVENTVIFPIQKIHRAVFRDHLRKIKQDYGSSGSFIRK